MARLADLVLTNMFGSENCLEQSLARLDVDPDGWISEEDRVAHLGVGRDLIVEVGVLSQLLAGQVSWATTLEQARGPMCRMTKL